MVLSLLFGVTGSVCSLFLRFGRRILLRVLSDDAKAEVRMLTNSEVVQFQSAFAAKYSMLSDASAVADGLKLNLEQSDDCVIQNMFYNDWKHDHYVSNVFVFAPSGVIMECAINAPGAMHDSQIAEWGNIYCKREDVFERCGGRCVVDCAFCKDDYLFSIKSAQDHLVITDNFPDIKEMRQSYFRSASVGGGNEGFERHLPRMKYRFIYEERGEIKLVLLCIVLLSNLRTRLVGINQLRSTYMPHMSVEVNHQLHSTPSQ